jgi:hypothetical protein
MSNITWKFQAAIPGGPALALDGPAIEVQAYDVASATIPASTPNIDLNIQPSSTANDVVLVVVYSDEYGDGLTYVVDGGSDTHALDAPHVFLGSGAVGFMNTSAPPQKLTFSSTLTKAAHVQVVVGRKNP